MSGLRTIYVTSTTDQTQDNPCCISNHPSLLRAIVTSGGLRNVNDALQHLCPHQPTFRIIESVELEGALKDICSHPLH